MQIKKEELRQTILEAATDEFMRKGYKDASMRVIARKAHTSLGNIYHYYKNKELLFDEVILPSFENIESLVIQHIEDEKISPLTKQEALYYAENPDLFFKKSGLGCFFDKRVVIILKLDSSHLLQRKEQLLDMLQEHIKDHLNLKEDAHYSKIILGALSDCLEHVLIEHENAEDAKAEFIKLFQIFLIGTIGQMK